MLDMTDQQLNRKLAQLMGYEAKKLGPYYMLVDNKGAELTGYRAYDTDIWDVAPNYCNDAAASLEVQARAIELDAEGYVLNLSNQVAESLLRKTTSPYYGTLVSRMLNASPRERAEAAYMTLSSRV